MICLRVKYFSDRVTQKQYHVFESSLLNIVISERIQITLIKKLGASYGLDGHLQALQNSYLITTSGNRIPHP